MKRSVFGAPYQSKVCCLCNESPQTQAHQTLWPLMSRTSSELPPPTPLTSSPSCPWAISSIGSAQWHDTCKENLLEDLSSLIIILIEVKPLETTTILQNLFLLLSLTNGVRALLHDVDSINNARRWEPKHIRACFNFITLTFRALRQNYIMYTPFDANYPSNT